MFGDLWGREEEQGMDPFATGTNLISVKPFFGGADFAIFNETFVLYN